MSRQTSTILTNLCLIEDCSTNKVVLQYRSPERYKKWSGYAFPGGHIEEGEVYWVEKDQLEKLDLSYDMLPLLEVMEDPDLSEFYYRKRTDDDWEKLRF